MKVTFISNYINHHQLPFSETMNDLLKNKYIFIQTKKMNEERINMGWRLDDIPCYVKLLYNSEQTYKECLTIIDESDVVIIGSAPDEFIINRLKQGKLTFKYSERFYKKGLPINKIPRAIIGAWLHYGRFLKYPFYLLCASAYTAADVNKFFNFSNRTYKWGYFPEVKHYDDIEKLIDNKKPNSILWAGRFIELKHPDASIYVAERLKSEGYDFRLNIIGDGVMNSQIQQTINEKNLEDSVYLIGSMKPEEVRKYMEENEIYLFTSDFNEGWGAVLNESMNSGCAVVASHAIGSVPFLIKNGENGLIYRNGDIEDLYKKVKFLLDNREKQKKYGLMAYRTMIEQWNAENAAERFIELSQSILNGNKTPDLFVDGVCSKAEIIKNNWFN